MCIKLLASSCLARMMPELKKYESPRLRRASAANTTLNVNPNAGIIDSAISPLMLRCPP